jgi:hypothetical protein
MPVRFLASTLVSALLLGPVAIAHEEAAAGPPDGDAERAKRDLASLVMSIPAIDQAFARGAAGCKGGSTKHGAWAVKAYENWTGRNGALVRFARRYIDENVRVGDVVPAAGSPERAAVDAELAKISERFYAEVFEDGVDDAACERFAGGLQGGRLDFAEDVRSGAALLDLATEHGVVVPLHEGHSTASLRLALLERRPRGDAWEAADLFCTGKLTSPVDWDPYFRALSKEFALPLATMTVEPLAPGQAEPGDFPTPPLGRIVSTFDASKQGDGGVVESHFVYGKQKGGFCLMRPATGGEAPRPPASRSVGDLLAAIGPPPAAVEPWNATPEALVRAFQADHLEWETVAVSRDRVRGDASSNLGDLDDARASYARMLHRYVLPGFQSEGVAYGDDPVHDPAKERVVSVDADGDAATVRTVLEGDFWNTQHEYVLERRSGRWYLEQVYWTDDDGVRYATL